ncbi:probable N-acetyltransferase camello [Pelobates fuscus]|uniref:probable N-acetyltransferase camello n=1 Tax=Pelobates fuscus TaxID=191477 RepID=UPI002FE48B46
MANFAIRRYKNRDYDIVRLLFAQGMIEHLPVTCIYILKLLRVHFVLMVSFISLLMASRSYLLSFMCMTAILAAGWQLLKAEFNHYVEQCYSEDLMDIEKSYMVNSRSCFWVAESNGRVIGIVGAQGAEESDDVMVLRRLSVAKDQRFKGVAKSLCTTVIDFARQQGCKNVTLETSMIQHGAHKLYESMDFQKTNVRVFPTWFARLTNFSVFKYTYNIETH